MNLIRTWYCGVGVTGGYATIVILVTFSGFLLNFQVWTLIHYRINFKYLFGHFLKCQSQFWFCLSLMWENIQFRNTIRDISTIFWLNVYFYNVNSPFEICIFATNANEICKKWSNFKVCISEVFHTDLFILFSQKTSANMTTCWILTFQFLD